MPVIVVGGGIAGAAFAIELARSGRQVILLERRSFASHKVCGDLLSEDAGDGMAIALHSARAAARALLAGRPGPISAIWSGCRGLSSGSSAASAGCSGCPPPAP